MQIDIISDTICPWCFIGKRRLERALAERQNLAVEIGWRPFQLNPDMPREGMSRDDYMLAKFGTRERLAKIFDNVIAAGLAEGIAFNFDAMRRTPSTLDSHRLIRWAASAGVQHQVVERLFNAYFIDGQDISDRSLLINVATENGMDGGLVGKLLADEADTDLIRREDAYARELGIQGVPCYIIERKYAVSGAQDPNAFLQIFDLVEREKTMPAA